MRREGGREGGREGRKEGGREGEPESRRAGESGAGREGEREAERKREKGGGGEKRERTCRAGPGQPSVVGGRTAGPPGTPSGSESANDSEPLDTVAVTVR